MDRLHRYYRIRSPNDLSTLRNALRDPARVDVADGMPRWYLFKFRLLFSGWMGDTFVLQSATSVDPLASRVVGALREDEEGTVLEIQVPEAVPFIIFRVVFTILAAALIVTVLIAKLSADSPSNPVGNYQFAVLAAMMLAAWVGLCIAGPLLAREGRARILQFIAEATGVPFAAWQPLQDRPESLSTLVCRGMRSMG